MKHLPIDNQSVIRLLQRIPVLQGLSRDDVPRIASATIARSFKAGETIGDFGDVVEEFWMIVEGTVETYFHDERGKLNCLASLGPDDHLGEMALIERTPRPIRIIAQTAGKLLAIPSEEFIAFVEAFPVLMRNLYRKLGLRFQSVVGLRTRQIPARRLGIIAFSRRSRILVARLIGRLAAQGEKLLVVTDDTKGIRDQAAWPDQVTLLESAAILDSPEAPSIDFDRQVFVVSQRSTDNVDFRRFHECDEVLWMLEPSDADKLATWLRLAMPDDGSIQNKMRLVWLLSNEQPVASWLPDMKFALNAIKLHVLEDTLSLSRLEKQGLDRLVRAMKGYRLGIALAGGGAKGMAHLGVLRALDEAGINFDIMSGTSAGAMAGIVYASGIEPSEAAQHFQRDLTPSRVFRALPGWTNLYLLHQFRRRAWDAMLRPYLHEWRLEQLPIDFLALTVDLVQGCSVIRKSGDAVHAILESINLPVISKPILRDGMMLVDGGMLDNLPADVLANQNCDFIVGVDVSRRMKFEFAGNRPDTPTKRMKNSGTLETLMRVFESQTHNLGTVRSRSIDFWITPDTSPFGLGDFYRSQEISAVGEQTARQIIPDLQQHLTDLERRLFDPAFL